MNRSYGLKYKDFIHFQIDRHKSLIDNLTNEICYKFKNFLNPGDVCLDVVLMLGLYLKMSKLIKQKGKVFSFEPVEVAYNQIKLLKKKIFS